MAVGTLVLTLALAAIPALATFPGENGRIAFGRRDPNIGDFELYTANSDGSDVQQLTFVPSFLSDWRADGKRIAFDFADADGNWQIATINPDGSNQQQITPLVRCVCASRVFYGCLWKPPHNY